MGTPIISLFSGGGFLDMGFIHVGFDVVYANEFNVNFANIYNVGVGSWSKTEQKPFVPISSTDSLVDLSADVITQKAFPNGIPKVWGIIGGPPCQDFSLNGSGKGFEGERGKMTQVFLDRIASMKPAFFVMENVKGLLLRDAAKQRLDYLIRKTISPDYYVDRKLLNAIEYGVPQSRERVFMIGLRKDLLHIKKDKEKDEINTMTFDWPIPIFENALKTYNWPTKNHFGDSIRKPIGIPKDLCVKYCLKSKSDANVSNIDEYFPLHGDVETRKLIDEGDTRRSSFKRLHRYRYSPTLCFGNNEVFLHPYENRRISVREALRIQGVSDAYLLPMGNLSSKFKIIGNGVPVPLAKAVANSLLDYMNNHLI